MNVPSPPPAAVLAAFGVEGPAQPIPGGQGTSWAARRGPDAIVLKPGADADMQQWLARTVASAERTGFRFADPVPTLDGAWVHEGWGATARLIGATPDHGASPRWHEILQAGRAFHRAVASLPRPALLDRLDNRWTAADRMAWGDEPLVAGRTLSGCVRRLRRALPPARGSGLGRSQLVHGDLTGNVLLADGELPGIIDVAPYWRPAAYAEGVVVADALCWHGAAATLPQELEVPLKAVVRALLFRVLAADAHAREAHARETRAGGTHAAGTYVRDPQALPAHTVDARPYEHAMDLLGL